MEHVNNGPTITIMTLASITFPELGITLPPIDPVIVAFGPFAIRWYALSYITGILLGWLYISRLNTLRPQVFTPAALENFIIWAILGILLGGRIGYVLFYHPTYYMDNPQEILMVWKGGMSFHGGLLGMILAMWGLSRRYGLSFLHVTDMLACAAPIGLFFGRIANFINGELYGRITDAKFGALFPGDPFTRHPSQLYEATLEGVALFIPLAFLVRVDKIRQRAGTLSGIFLLGYGIARFLVEYVREPDAQLGLFFSHISMGQLLCIPMILIGLWLITRRDHIAEHVPTSSRG